MDSEVTTDGSVFTDDVGWTWLPRILTPAQSGALAEACLDKLATIGDGVRVGDKPWSGTRRLVDLRDRLPEVEQILVLHRDVRAAIEPILGPNPTCSEVIFRCPFPGFGGQKLHADDLPLVDPNQTLGLTAIVPLVDFTADNGATRLIPGSHRRPDLQRLSGSLDDHPDAIVLTGPAGGMFLFSRHILHSGTRNDSVSPRPAVQICWTR